MKSKLALATMLAVAFIAPAALPCGAPFGNGINVDPRQDIVVVHKNGAETYVFQPRFCGSAKEFGLILPVPAKLSAQPALSKAEVFTRLNTISAPTIAYTTACSNRNGGWGGSSGSGSPDGGGTSVVSSGTVGFMDYAQLETSSLDALTTWLATNGYPYDSLAQSAFQYYVDKGWYFVAFRVSQGTFTGTTTCKDLGPVKLAFPTATPVVPTRMATARSQDTSGATPYSSGFSWRIFGITAGTEQIGFADAESSTRVLNYSGLLVGDDISYLDSLAVAGDRADKLTITFNYGSTDPDIALSKVAAKDYREVVTYTTYITCTDGGTDTTPLPADAGLDVAPDLVTVPVDLAPVLADAQVQKDAYLSNPPEGPDKGDAAPVVVQDAASVTPRPDAGVTADAASPPAIRHSGCSFVASASASGRLPALVLLLALGLVRRRR